MSYQLYTTKQFDKALKRCQKRGYDIERIKTAIEILVDKGQLPQEYRPHILHGNHDKELECHIGPDWLMTWLQNDNKLTLLMLSTGTHSDLFDKKRR